MLMEQIKIFLFDFCPSEGLGSKLRRILESSDLCIQLQYKPFKVFSSSIYDLFISPMISQSNPDMIFLILLQSHIKHASSLFQFLRRELSEQAIIGVIKDCNSDEIFSLLEFGITDFIIPPLNEVDIITRVCRIMKQMRRCKTLTYKLTEKIALERLVGESSTFLSEKKKLPLIAKCDANVLISGETGTGKDLFSRAIHYLGARASKPFIPVNCGAIPIELVENELFGHLRGAFTGAFASQQGLIHEANNGTLFLDEIDCLPFPSQVNLLRFFQEKEYRQIGSTKIKHLNVRVIASTNINLEEAVRERKFRQDLYYRLNIIPIVLPPLRDRLEDIPLLAYHFLSKYSTKFNKQVNEFTPEAIQKLLFYNWQGNVRELEYIIERAVIFSEKEIIQSNDIILPNLKSTTPNESFKDAKTKVIDQFEVSYIQRLLFAHQGNITKAAQAAKKDRRSFWQLIRKHQIDTERFKFKRTTPDS